MDAINGGYGGPARRMGGRIGGPAGLLPRGGRPGGRFLFGRPGLLGYSLKPWPFAKRLYARPRVVGGCSRAAALLCLLLTQLLQGCSVFTVRSEPLPRRAQAPLLGVSQVRVRPRAVGGPRHGFVYCRFSSCLRPTPKRLVPGMTERRGESLPTRRREPLEFE